MQILETLRDLGVRVAVVGGEELELRSAGKIPADILERVRKAKPQILEALRHCAHCKGSGRCSCPACTLRRAGDESPCSMCHPEERRTWLLEHSTPACQHCGGSKKCRCIACAERMGKPGVCLICHGTGRGQEWIQ